jgi:RNA-directed DNA polymerase
MIERKPYPIHQSALYKIKSPAQLADVLGVSQGTINHLLSCDENYIRFKNVAGRDVQWPKPRLRHIQKRAAILLGRIETPDFLHSAKRGRSYITNADQHSPSLPSIKIDIRKFFQSVRVKAVFHFFHDKMCCVSDVAAILTRLMTVDDHLATGGNASPILSYFAYMDMFSEINELAEKRNCRMTCLMDDMTFTGPGATRNLIYEVRRILARYRLWAHKTKMFKACEPKVITGVAVTMSGRRVPNNRQRVIRRDLRHFSAAQSDYARMDVLPRLIGRVHEAAQVDPTWLPRAKALVAQRAAIAKRLSGNSGSAS